ncbi:MAG: hypothetical protein JST45_07405 [Bacteroidetes bacterium]|nr:hypothetical protein [Bacteroidota bacterium]
MEQAINNHAGTITLELEGPRTATEWQALLKRYLDMASKNGVVRFFAHVRDGAAWESITKFIYLVRWKLLDAPVDQRIVLATTPALLANGTGLLATHTPNMQVRVVDAGQRAEADQWLLEP